jgi:cytidylate kinase
MEHNILFHLSKRKENNRPMNGPGPVITISREYGCNANQIAQMLCDQLNQTLQNDKKQPLWKWISKEVLEKAADDLKKHPSALSQIFSGKENPLLEDLIISFSNKSYLSDAKIKKLIIDVVKQYAELGHVIIVGRAGCIITRDYPKTFHIKIFAPVYWRIEQVQQRFKYSLEEAKRRVIENDQNRTTFMGFYKGNVPDNQVFDMMFNRSTIPENIITDTIIKYLELKKFLS